MTTAVVILDSVERTLRAQGSGPGPTSLWSRLQRQRLGVLAIIQVQFDQERQRQPPAPPVATPTPAPVGRPLRYAAPDLAMFQTKYTTPGPVTAEHGFTTAGHFAPGDLPADLPRREVRLPIGPGRDGGGAGGGRAQQVGVKDGLSYLLHGQGHVTAYPTAEVERAVALTTPGARVGVGLGDHKGQVGTLLKIDYVALNTEKARIGLSDGTAVQVPIRFLTDVATAQAVETFEVQSLSNPPPATDSYVVWRVKGPKGALAMLGTSRRAVLPERFVEYETSVSGDAQDYLHAREDGRSAAEALDRVQTRILEREEDQTLRLVTEADTLATDGWLAAQTQLYRRDDLARVRGDFLQFVQGHTKDSGWWHQATDAWGAFWTAPFGYPGAVAGPRAGEVLTRTGPAGADSMKILGQLGSDYIVQTQQGRTLVPIKSSPMAPPAAPRAAPPAPPAAPRAAPPAAPPEPEPAAEPAPPSEQPPQKPFVVSLQANYGQRTQLARITGTDAQYLFSRIHVTRSGYGPQGQSQYTLSAPGLYWFAGAREGEGEKGARYFVLGFKLGAWDRRDVSLETAQTIASFLDKGCCPLDRWAAFAVAPDLKTSVARLLGAELNSADTGDRGEGMVLDIQGDTLVLRAERKLSTERYKEALALLSGLGSEYDKQAMGWSLPAEELSALRQILPAAHFKLKATPAAAGLIQQDHERAVAQAERNKANLAAAAVRVDRLAAQMARKGLTLRLYQKEGAQWLAADAARLLGDDMGLGKTAQALAAIPGSCQPGISEQCDAPVLVVGPALAKGVWLGEVRKFRPELTPRILAGRNSFEWPGPGQVYITNYDVLPTSQIEVEEKREELGEVAVALVQDEAGLAQLRRAQIQKERAEWSKKARASVDQHRDSPPQVRDAAAQPILDKLAALDLAFKAPPEQLAEAMRADLLADQTRLEMELSELVALLPPGPAPAGLILIADEAHLLKTAEARRTRRFRHLVELGAKAGGRTWLLTGTPMLNKPPELWEVLQTCGLGVRAFGSFQRFRRLFGAKKGSGGQGTTWGSVSPGAIEALKSVMLRRLKVDVLSELPAKQRQDVPVPLGPQEMAKLEAAMPYLDIFLDKYVRAELEKSTKRAVADAGGVAFAEISKALATLARAKIPALVSLVEDYEAQGIPLVVFSKHRDPVEHMGRRPGWAVIHGDILPEERTRIAQEFQAGKYKGVAGTIAAMGTAVTLTYASNTIFVDRDWTPSLNKQAEDRTNRMGQKSGCMYKFLIADHALDERLSELLAEKQYLIEEGVDGAAIKEGQASLAQEAPPAPTIELVQSAPTRRESLLRLPQTIAEHWAVMQHAAAETLYTLRQLPTLGEALLPFSDAQVLEAVQAHLTRPVHPSGAAPVPQAQPEARTERPVRGPRSELEQWASRGILSLTAMDDDKQTERNGAGWNQSDGEMGHKWARKLQTQGGLTEAEWGWAVQRVRKYHGQIGEPPDAEIKPGKTKPGKRLQRAA